MEMDSSSRSRSFDRSSRDSAILKKPRLLAEEPAILRGDNNKPNGSGPLVQRQPPGGFRQAAERDRDSKSGGIGGGGYQPQSLTQTQIQQQQHQELVSQYRTALAELTFNSKPIITNLTIIAGENLHAARAIAATICSNILEVPSDQKLPSLYLLDSIVKNIGRDYIKHFAARLPEVFCKAYRQVDSAIHPGMRHLFGTWKGVFPPQTLQMIEKELGFQPAANGSSAGLTTSASESQSQRPGRSIHVNPKYLEARQRLQQSGRAKGATNNMMTNLVNSPEDTERVDITAANITSGRQLADPRLKMHAQRDIESNSIHDSSSAGCGDLDYGSDMLGPSEASFGKSNERVAEQGSWYGPGSNSAETISMHRNGFDMKHGPPNYSAPRSSIADAKVQPMNNLVSKRVSEVNRSWKNSEEEEYMWDDMNSRLAIPGASSSSKRDPRLHFESERSGFENHPQKSKAAQDLASRLDRETSSDSLSTEQKDQAACRQMPLLKSQGLSLTDGVGPLRSGRNVLDHAECFPTSFGRLSTTVNSLSRTSLQSQMVSNHIGTQSFGFPSNTVTAQQRHAVGAVTPSAQVPVHQRPPSPSFSQYQPSKSPNNIAEQDWPAAHLLPHADAKAARSRGQIHTVLPSQSPQASFQTMPQNSHLGSHQKLQPHNLQKPSSQLPLSHTIHAPFLQTLQPESISESGQAPELPPQIYVAAKQLVNSSLDHSKSLVADIPVSSSTSNLLAAVSSVFGNKSIAGGIAESTFESEPSLRPHPPNGSPLTQLTSSHSRVVSPFTSPYSQESTSFSASISQRKVDKPPLPPGPPPSTSGTTSTQTSSVVNAVLNPVSSLLSTLVAKGIISASKSDSPSSSASTRKSESPKKDSPTARAASPILGSSLLSTSSTDEDFSLGKAATKHTVTVPQSAKVDMESLIGFEFKPDVIRESHPAVISKLIDDLPHQCSICGLRFKLQEGFDRHKEWHKLRNSESHTPNKALRRWYANSDDWLNGKPNLQLSNDTTDLMDSTEELLEIDGEQMIAADESQCVCILCGNLFEDFYSLERDKWMFKGATYLSKTDGEVGYISSCAIRGPIVHANCISESSIFDLDLFNDVEVEKDI